jgi:hypothetical protein
MNIDLLPFAAFALESSGMADRPCGEPHTLTLRLARPSLHSSFGPPMSGKVRIEEIPVPCEGVLHAAVLPADGPGLTITF